MAPAKSLDLRGCSVSPGTRAYDTSLIKVDGEVFDRDGYRMDVTVWFRHRNEVLYYLDSGGAVHGPMDQRHSTRLGNISRSGQFIPGSRYYLADSGSRTLRHQSESGAWDTKSEMRSYNVSDTFRDRAYSESRPPPGMPPFYHQQQHNQQFRSTVSHAVPAVSPTHISRWSSMQSAGGHGLWRGTGSNRYATTLTRQHIKRYRDPVEMLVKHAPSAGASKIDLVSIDNRRDVSPGYSPSANIVYERDARTERERMLQEELLSTKRELLELKRTRSLIGDQNLLSPSSIGRNMKSSSNQYLNEQSWTTHTLKKNEGQPCGAPIARHSASQTNLSNRPGLLKTMYASDTNLKDTSTFRQVAQHSNYSAHRENQRKMEEQRRNAENLRGSTRHVTDIKATSGTEVLEETETITLQPIGAGVHDLEPPQTLTRSVRAGTPLAARQYSAVPTDQTDGYRTIATTNVHREVFPNTPDYRSQNNVQHPDSINYNQMTPIYQEAPNTVTRQIPRSPYAPNLESNLRVDYLDPVDQTMRKVRETNSVWYNPKCSKVQAMELLRYKEVGSFLIRNSESHRNSFSISVRTSPSTSYRKDETQTGYVRPYLIALEPMVDGVGNGYSIQGFANQPVFSSLMELVHFYLSHIGPWNCLLRLPPVGRSKPTHTGAGISADLMYLGSMNADHLSSEEAIRQACTDLIIAPRQAAIRDRTALPCEVQFKATIRDGVVFSNNRNQLYKRLKPNTLMWCGLDPDGRRYQEIDVQHRGVVAPRTKRIFGIVTRKQKLFHHENTVYLFCEIDPNQEATGVVNYISNEMIH